MSIKYGIGDRVKTTITDEEGTVIAVDDVKDEYAMVKVKYDCWFKFSSWEFETMLTRIITSNNKHKQNMKKIFKEKEIKTKEEARQYAIDWQNWTSEQNLSMEEIVQWYGVFSELASKFDLEEEFQENGII